MAKKKMYALVKWIGGDDDKKYTTGIPIEWIKNFNLVEFRSENFDPSESYVIEWRGSKKCPPSGWPVYDGYVVAVSVSNAVLENKLQMLDGLLSPTKHSVFPEDQENVMSKAPIDSGENSNNEQFFTNKDIDSERDAVNKSLPSTSYQQLPLHHNFPAKTPVHKEKRVTSTESLEDLSTSQNSELIHSTSGLSGIVPLPIKKSKVQLYKNIGEDGFTQTLGAIHDELRRLRKKRSHDSSDDSDASEDPAKEIGRKGSGVEITDEQWDAARSAKSYTAMGISLLLSLFPLDVLLRSNLRGGSQKVAKASNANENINNSKYTALDPARLDSLYYTVKKRWKNSFNKAGLGIAINNKMTQLRATQKRKQQPED